MLLQQHTTCCVDSSFVLLLAREAEKGCYREAHDNDRLSCSRGTAIGVENVFLRFDVQVVGFDLSLADTALGHKEAGNLDQHWIIV